MKDTEDAGVLLPTAISVREVHSHSCVRSGSGSLPATLVFLPSGKLLFLTASIRFPQASNS